MKRWYWFIVVLATIAAAVVVGQGAAAAQIAGSGKDAFGFESSNVQGFPTGSAEITGGGAYDLATNFVNSAGSFRCTSNINQGPLSGCLAGQGIRWDTAALLASSDFKCTGALSEPAKTAHTNDHTIVIVADFYRQGDGNVESFTAKMIVSDTDLAPDILGVKNVWIQGVGCGSAVVNFK